MKKRILLVEDDDLLRLGLKSMVQARKEFSVESDTGSGKEAIRLFNFNRPDIVLLDLLLPDTPGLDVLRHMKKTAPQVPSSCSRPTKRTTCSSTRWNWGPTATC
jgi:DNA-binding NarL/FixJ family response regulator